VTITTDPLNLEREVLDLITSEPSGPTDECLRSLTRQSALLMLSRCAQSVEPAGELFSEAAILAASTLDSEVLATLELDATTGKLSQRISQRLEAEVELVHFETRNEASSPSVLGFAFNAGHPIVVADLANDKRFVDRLSAETGVRSGIACPVLYQDRKFGAIGVFSRGPRDYTQDDVLFVHSLALLLGPAMAHRRAEKTLADQSQFLSFTIDSLESLVVSLSEEGDILRLNQAARALSGFTLKEIRHRTLSGTFLLPEETSLVYDAFARLKAGESPVKCETFLLTKRGDRRRISWVFSRLPFASSQGPTVIASGIDVTDQYNALEKLDELSGESRASQENAARKVRGADMSETKEVERHTPPGEQVTEHRSYPRRSYPYLQSIGVCRSGRLPEQDEFFEVRCRDISPRGFSYVTDVAPDFFEFIVALGSPPSQLFLQSRVVHVSPLVHEGRNCLLVGCQYIERIELPASK
jgi:PAS domain S-box-containing protein